MSSSENKINQLQKRLNSNDQPAAEHNESSLSRPDDADTPHDWKHDQEQDSSGQDILNKFLLFAGIFCLLAAGFAAVVIGYGSPSVSPERVDISVSGPNTVSAGETTNLNIAVTNNNEKTLQDVSLTIEFPPGTRQPETGGAELRRIQRNIGSIEPGETSQIQAAAGLFGQQDETQEINITAEYSIDDSNAIFSANSRYPITIGELPIAMDISAPDQTSPGQPITFDISIQSNSTKTLNNVLVRGEYPFGFTTTQTAPEPMYQNNVWSLGDLEPGEQESITVTGRFGGGISSGQRTIRFASGIASAPDSVEIGTLFAERSQTLGLQAPLLGLSLDIGTEEQGQFSLTSAREISGSISYQNNVDQPLRATEITLSITGDSVNADSVTAEQGLYRKKERRITWNGQTTEPLQTIAPGDSGNLPFSLETKGADDLADIENPTVDFTADVRAEPPTDTSLPNPITAELTQTAKVLSDVNVTTESLRNADAFAVSGPYPPEVDTATDYVLRVAVANTSNQLSNIRLQADVPAYVSVVEDPQLSDGSFTYNETIGRMRWEINELSAGAGYRSDPAEMYLPVTIEPTLSQQGGSPELLNNITFSAVDDFVETTINLDNIDEPTTQAQDVDDNSSGSVVDEN